MPGTRRDLERWFQWAMGRLGLPVSRYTSAGIRAGGATHEYLCGTTVERLMGRGRWEALSTLKHYVQESAWVLAAVSLPSDFMMRVVARGEALGAALRAVTVSWPVMGHVERRCTPSSSVDFD